MAVKKKVVYNNNVSFFLSFRCVANNSIVTNLSKPSHRQLRIDIKFMGFTDQAQVVYHAIAKPCKTGCILKCNIPYFKENRYDDTLNNINHL